MAKAYELEQKLAKLAVDMNVHKDSVSLLREEVTEDEIAEVDLKDGYLTVKLD